MIGQSNPSPIQINGKRTLYRVFSLLNLHRTYTVYGRLDTMPRSCEMNRCLCGRVLSVNTMPRCFLDF